MSYDAETHAVHMLAVVKAAHELAAAIASRGGLAHVRTGLEFPRHKRPDTRSPLVGLLAAVDALVRFRKDASLRGLPMPEDAPHVAEAIAALVRHVPDRPSAVAE